MNGREGPPLLLRCPHGRNNVTRERALEVILRCRDEGIRFLVRHEVVKGDNVRVGACEKSGASHAAEDTPPTGSVRRSTTSGSRCAGLTVHSRLEARQLDCSLKGADDVALAFGRPVVPLVAVGVAPTARLARVRTRTQHEARVYLALSRVSPCIARGIIVLVGTVCIGRWRLLGRFFAYHVGPSTLC